MSDTEALFQTPLNGPFFRQRWRARYPQRCEEPDPGIDAEYGATCGAQEGEDWGFTWVTG